MPRYLSCSSRRCAILVVAFLAVNFLFEFCTGWFGLLQTRDPKSIDKRLSRNLGYFLEAKKERIAVGTAGEPDGSIFTPDAASIVQNASNEKIVNLQFQKRPLPLDYEKYLNIRASYEKTLAGLTREHFGPSNNVFIGAPISTLLDKSRDVGGQIKAGSVLSASKLILLWTPFYEKKDWITSDVFAKCRARCTVSTNKSDLRQSDAVVIHTPDLRKIWKLPPWRAPHQRFLYYLDEGPHYNGMMSQASLNGVFNWTMTVREDSDFLTRYIETRKRVTPLSQVEFEQHFTRIIRKKTKTVSAMISNCQSTATTRLAYVRELKNYIDVDFYGACGDIKTECPRVYRRGEFQCTKNIHSKYKFFLSFENSNCRNYVTEKSKLPLIYWNAVPVVMGGINPEDYESLLPPNSYIHTRGFNSPKALADYLQILDRNMTLYQSYFQWHRTHEVMPDPPIQWCPLCEALHNTSSPVKVYRNFLGWFNENHNTCRMGG